jgi:hypothetical protein
MYDKSSSKRDDQEAMAMAQPPKAGKSKTGGRPKQLGDNPGLLFLRLPEELMARIDEAAAWMTTQAPWGVTVTRSQAARAMLAFASTQAEFLPNQQVKPGQSYVLDSDVAPPAEPAAQPETKAKARARPRKRKPAARKTPEAAT